MTELHAYLHHLAKWMLIAIAAILAMAMWLALITMAHNIGPRQVRVDCSLAEFHPDYTLAMRQACRDARRAAK